MSSKSIVTRFWPWKRRLKSISDPQTPPSVPLSRPDLQTLAAQPNQLPQFVQESAVAMRYLRFLSPFAWHAFPERKLDTPWFVAPTPYRPFVAAYLVKLDQQLTYMTQLRTYLVEHPALVWILGFPLLPAPHLTGGFAVDASLPTARHFTRMLRTIPNASLQWLLDETVRLLTAELTPEVPNFGQTIALDTKHILAWVKENNPKTYVKQRYAKDKQPRGDPDCRLGCKRKRNQRTATEKHRPTPHSNPQPATGVPVAEYVWGYASGVVTTKALSWGEIVLAELTQPFDQSDISYFFPLLTATERRLGFRPRFGAFDAAFDAWYVYAHFHRDGHPIEYAFAAVPFSQRGGHQKKFHSDGAPLCAAGLPMPRKSTYHSRSGLVPHECGVYVCPLLYPQPTADVCPINDHHWAKGGCQTRMALSIGARIRYQLDRECAAYKTVYQQRTATERINSLAKELGIERPKLRNQAAIANQNTLIYVLLNLRTLQRVRRKKAERYADK